MRIYSISDLHLAISIDKPMDVFGQRWNNYMERIRENWINNVRDEDLVLIPGDVSWATYIDQAVEDFAYINDLPGIKVISKGNHDYWWTTLSKLEKFKTDNNFFTIKFLHNNCIVYRDWVICGARGWLSPENEEFTQEDKKIYYRELQRLELSLKTSNSTGICNIIVMLHYPPFDFRKNPTEFVELMIKYNVKKCVYGHLHGEAAKTGFQGNYSGIDFYLVSADYLGFKPLIIT